MRKKVCTIASISVAILFTLNLLASPSPAALKMPSFSLESAMTNKKIHSKSFEGKSLLVVFFATWCLPCVQEIPTLIDIQKKYAKRNFSVVALSVDHQGKEVVRDLAQRERINYPVMMADESVVMGFEGVYGIPTAFLVNSRGVVVKKYTGYTPHGVFVRDIEQIID